MADAIKLEIVTPTGVEFSRDVLDVSAPTVDGEIGVLPGHLPLLAAVRTGVATVRPVGGDKDALRFAVFHGVFEIAGEKALLLTEKFKRKEDVDVVGVRARFKEVGEELLAWSGDLDAEPRVALIEEEQWLAAQLELIGDPPAPATRELTRFQTREPEWQPVESSDEGSGSGPGEGEPS
jgi:F-type H+-transporting ATPase subunit epsilon